MTSIRLTESLLRPLAEAGHSTLDIAAMLNSSQSAIHKAMQRLGIPCGGKPGAKKGGGRNCYDGPGIGYDPNRTREMTPIGEWPDGMQFEDAAVPPLRAGRPRPAEPVSGCSSAALACVEGV